MRYHLPLLLVLALFAVTTAQAQLITDPARATAARDTLLRQAEQLRRGAAQASPAFITNAKGKPRHRVVVIGVVSPALLPAGLRSQGQPVIRWRHVTRYHRNGRVQERYQLTLNGNDVLRERRLNGTVTWLSMPAGYSQVAGIALRHRGLYLRPGYVRLDNESFALPQLLP